MEEIKEKAQKIIAHAVQLGFPPDVIPDAPYLERILRTSNCPVFDNFLQRVHDKERVKFIRDSILVYEAKEGTSKPEQIDKFIKHMKLKEDLQEAKSRFEKLKKAQQHQIEQGFAEYVRQVKLEEANRELEVRINILRAKSMNLDDEIEKELEVGRKLDSITPPIYSADMNVDELKEKIMQALDIIKTFNSNSQDYDQLWTKLKNVLSTVPNAFTFQMVMKQLDEIIKEMENLRSPLPSEKHSESLEEKLLNELDQYAIVAGIELQSLRKETAQMKSVCSKLIEEVTNDLEDKLNNSNEDSFGIQDEDIVGDYVSVMLKNLALKGKLEYVQNFVEKSRSQSEEMEKTKQEYMQTIRETQELHSRVEQRLHELQHSIAQLHKINLKINSGRITLAHLVQELEISSKKQKMNRMLMTTDPDDIEPPHMKELQLFLDTPVHKFEKISPIVAFELKQNHLFKNDENIAVLTELMHLPTSDLNQLIKAMKQNYEFYNKLQSNESKSKIVVKCLPEVPIKELEEKIEENREAIVELLDKITETNAVTKSLLSDNKKLIDYSINNPLKDFIPHSKKFEGKSYKTYEAEFNVYYRMLKD